METRRNRRSVYAALLTSAALVCIPALPITNVPGARGTSALEASYFEPLLATSTGNSFSRPAGDPFKGGPLLTASAPQPSGRVAGYADVPMSASAQMVYGPAVQRAVYGLSANETGAGQTIAVIGWGNPLSDADLATWAGESGVAPLTSGSGAGQVQWLSVSGGSASTTQSTQAEVAMDVEYAHAIAPQASLRVYFVPDTCDQTTCKGDWGSLEAAVSAAVADGAKIITGSWGAHESDLGEAGISTFEPILQSAAANGASFFFASGDTGSAGGVEYPASSPWAVAVGGAQLNAADPASAANLAGWSLSGGGCSTQLARPSWQPAVLAGCANRAVPDLALDAAPNTGVPIYFSLGSAQGWLIAGGTSLATPMAAALYADVCAEAACGWANPALATAGSQAGAYSPVLSGSNGDYQAGPGWNALTGWGVPNFAVWRAAMAGAAPVTPAAPTATPVPAATSIPAAPSATAIRLVPTASPTRAARQSRGSRMS